MTGEPPRREQPQHALALRDLRRLVGRHEVRAAVALAHVGAEEADQMIDAIAVVELGARAGRAPQPVVAAGGDHVPAVGREAPVLAGLRKRVRRRADRRVEPELLLPRPDVGAVAADHEGKVAEDADRAARRRARAPLLVGEPLQVRVEEDLRREPLAARRERVRARDRAARRVPLVPVPPVAAAVQRAKERVVVEPPALALDERRGTRARGSCRCATRRVEPRRTPPRSADDLSARTVGSRRPRPTAPRSSSARSLARERRLRRRRANSVDRRRRR